MNKNISSVHDCYGCGVCATACGRKIIEINLNDDGFYEPHITDESRCTNCGVCTEVCAYLHEELASKETKIYPNDPCPCGSGKKYKKCCGRR